MCNGDDNYPFFLHRREAGGLSVFTESNRRLCVFLVVYPARDVSVCVVLVAGRNESGPLRTDGTADLNG